VGLFDACRFFLVKNGFEENKGAAKRGGQIASNARRELEEETGESVIAKNNFLSLTEKKKLDNKKKK